MLVCHRWGCFTRPKVHLFVTTTIAAVYLLRPISTFTITPRRRQQHATSYKAFQTTKIIPSLPSTVITTTTSSPLTILLHANSDIEKNALPEESQKSNKNTNNNNISNSIPSSRRHYIKTSTLSLASIILATSSSSPTTAATETTTTTTASDPITSSATKIPTTTLGKSQLTVSRTIQGYWQLAGGHGKYNQDDAIQNMQSHYNSGITTLDTADIYGPSETIIGKFIKKQQQQQQSTPPPIPLTKFCCFRFLDDIDLTEVTDRINRSRDRLNVSTLPLVQFFWSNYDIKRYVTVGLYLAELQSRGLIGDIGATNFDLPRLVELKEAGVPIVSHQVQLSALDRRAVQSGMSDWCVENDVSLLAFGTVAGGILSGAYSSKTAGPGKEELNTASLRLYDKTVQRFGSWGLVRELLDVMEEVARGVNDRLGGGDDAVTVANVAQRYVLETPGVASILIGVRNTNHLKENVRTHSFELTKSEREAIDDVVKKRKGPKGDVWDLERGVI